MTTGVKTKQKEEQCQSIKIERKIEMAKFEFHMVWTEYGKQSVEVPDGLTEKQALDWVKEHWDEIPLPEGDYLEGSDSLDEEGEYGFVGC